MRPLRPQAVLWLPALLGRGLVRVGVVRGPEGDDWVQCESAASALRLAGLVTGERAATVAVRSSIEDETLSVALMERLVKRGAPTVVPLALRLPSEQLAPWLDRIGAGAVPGLSESERYVLLGQGLGALGARGEIGRVPMARAYLNQAVLHTAVQEAWAQAALALLLYVPDAREGELCQIVRICRSWTPALSRAVSRHPGWTPVVGDQLFASLGGSELRSDALLDRPTMARRGAVQDIVFAEELSRPAFMAFFLRSIPDTELPALWQRALSTGKPRAAVSVLRATAPERLGALLVSEADMTRLLTDTSPGDRVTVLGALSAVSAPARPAVPR